MSVYRRQGKVEEQEPPWLCRWFGHDWWEQHDQHDHENERVVAQCGRCGEIRDFDEYDWCYNHAPRLPWV